MFMIDEKPMTIFITANQILRPLYEQMQFNHIKRRLVILRPPSYAHEYLDNASCIIYNIFYLKDATFVRTLCT